MPTREELIAALQHQVDLVDEVRELRAAEDRRMQRDRRWRLVLTALTIIVAIAAVFGVVAWKASRDALHAGKTAERAVKVAEANRQEARLVACRLRNESQRQTRTSIDQNSKIAHDSVVQLLVSLRDAIPIDPNSRFGQFVEAQINLPPPDVTPTAEVVDSDCDLNGVIDSADYP